MCLFFICSFAIPVRASTEDLVPIDAVLILDVSRSMITADPERIANDAMNMFIDMLEIGRDRVGVVAYAGHVTHSSSLTLLDYDNVTYLQDIISNLAYASWTDHPLGLLEALRILTEDFSEYRQQVVVFLTDGNLNVNPFGSRTTAQAENDKLIAISIAQEYGIPIYSIGLNFDGALDRKYTEVVAGATGGLAFETANAEDLPDILNTIFALMTTVPPPPVLEEPTPPEEAPEYEPVTHTYEEKPVQYIYKPTKGIIEERTTFWYFIAAIIATLLILLVALKNRTARVFTGRLAIEIIDDTQISPVQYVNLIEYGSRTTLQRLIKREVYPEFKWVMLYPSPTAPSHLPQIVIKYKKAKLIFTKDFITQDATAGISISNGTEIIVAHQEGGKQIRLKYVI